MIAMRSSSYPSPTQLSLPILITRHVSEEAYSWLQTQLLQLHEEKNEPSFNYEGL